MISGLMGGTFDPIHLGHLHIARTALKDLALDRVIFLPDGDPPHKRPRATGAQRLHMAKLACADEPRFLVSDMELTRPGPTYTVDTLRALRSQDPDEQLVYLIGSDTLFLFHTWKTAAEVARLCRMGIVLRPGDEREAVVQKQQELRLSHGLDSVLLSREGLPISSGLVRNAVRDGHCLDALVPGPVAEYIALQGLYRDKGHSCPITPASSASG